MITAEACVHCTTWFYNSVTIKFSGNLLTNESCDVNASWSNNHKIRLKKLTILIITNIKINDVLRTLQIICGICAGSEKGSTTFACQFSLSSSSHRVTLQCSPLKLTTIFWGNYEKIDPEPWKHHSQTWSQHSNRYLVGGTSSVLSQSLTHTCINLAIWSNQAEVLHASLLMLVAVPPPKSLLIDLIDKRTMVTSWNKITGACMLEGSSHLTYLLKLHPDEAAMRKHLDFLFFRSDHEKNPHRRYWCATGERIMFTIALNSNWI